MDVGMKLSKYKDFISGLVISIVGVVYYIQSFSIRVTRVGGNFNSRMFPQLIAVSFIVLGLLLASREFKAVFASLRGRNTASNSDGEESDATTGSSFKVLQIFLISFAYVLLLVVTGFLVATPIFIFVFIRILTPRTAKFNLRFSIVLAVISTAVLYLMFRYGFSMILPRGIL